MKFQKPSYIGMAGHYAAMSEFLLRGYNVAIPAVDVGDDVLVIDDGAGTLWRVQVKTGNAGDGDASLLPRTESYTLSRRQLREAKATQLYFMLMIRWQRRWRFLLIPREDLAEIRETFEASPRDGKPGRPPTRASEATSDTLTLQVAWDESSAEGWGKPLGKYLDVWPEGLPELSTGPGAVATTPRR